MSTASTSPATLFGGTWQQLKDRFLLGAGDTYTAGTSGGSASHYHTLNAAYAKIGYKTDEESMVYRETGADEWENNVRVNGTRNFSPTAMYNFGASLGGSTDGGDNMPPYFVVYMWKRTA